MCLVFGWYTHPCSVEIYTPVWVVKHEKEGDPPFFIEVKISGTPPSETEGQKHARHQGKKQKRQHVYTLLYIGDPKFYRGGPPPSFCGKNFPVI